ncbi:NAD-dependent epimerase/dehydratase family protein [Neobacillus citreus]|uniref:NAD(P)-dependent oxidoreductase n=1 Tax=Neobacillus citreus TaxID=2833578 RepID=A0A942T1H4_9BACI|nr:NAD(P)-dependent oxidoreductase [Neobacillus citreus]MCH6268414.1 NAD(P)-dependent oxidoreductase [Neobacillus citreus]
MKRILVTGANGWIGSHVIKKLIEKDFEVHAVSRKFVNTPMKKCKWHRADLLILKETRNLIENIKPTHLLHFAWEATPGEYWRSLNNYLWVQASIELLYNFAKYGGKRAVFAGTCAEYDWSYGYLSENITPCSNKPPYASAKNALQSLVRSFSESVGLSSAWGRIFFLYGPKEHRSRLVPTVINSLINNKQALCTHGEQYRDFLHVEDASEAFVSLLESDAQGPVNIASGHSIQVKEMISRIADKLGKSELVKLGAIPFPDTEPLFIGANTKLLKDEIKWSPKIDLDRGLERTIAWWRKNQV